MTYQIGGPEPRWIDADEIYVRALDSESLDATPLLDVTGNEILDVNGNRILANG